jgi:putative ABC transport system substrate-binding protein
MRRREFITLLGGAAAAWPIVARGQERKFARIGALVLTSADAQSLAKALREGLREFGYAEGQNFAFEVRSADGNTDRLPELASELARLPVDVIVATFTPCALAAKQATTTIPIVMAAVADPVGSPASCRVWRDQAETSQVSPTWLLRRPEKVSNYFETCCPR